MISLWCRTNLLEVNVSKTKSMFFSHKRHVNKLCTSNLEVSFNSEPIELVSEYKYLGVWIDSQLSFAKHVKTIIKNVSFRLSKLSKIRDSLSKKTSLLLYKALILPLYDYGHILSFYMSKSTSTTPTNTAK